jgi:hypothetical protein
MRTFETEDRFLGIKFWVIYTPSTRYIYTYQGQDRDSGLYYFKEWSPSRVIKSRGIVKMNHNQMITNGIKPLCLNHAYVGAIEEKLADSDNGNKGA